MFVSRTLSIVALSLIFNLFAMADVTYSSDGVYRTGKATLQKVNNVNIIHLYGTRAEMATQHGEFTKHFLKDKNEPSALDFFINSINGVINSDKSPTGLVKKAFVKFASLQMKSKISKEDREVVAAFAKSSGYTVNETMEAAVFPDLGEFLMAKQFSNNRGFGCTTILVSSERSTEGLIHGRNFDFYSSGIWEKNLAVIYYHPSNPSEQMYAEVGSLGILISSPTTFNESGLFIDLHQLTTKDVAMNGTPIVLTLQKVAREAKTMDQALAILKNSKYSAPWKINITSAKENKMVTVDVSAKTFHVFQPENNLIVETNHVNNVDVRKNLEFFANYNVFEDSMQRKSFVSKALANFRSVSSQNVADLLAGHEVLQNNKIVSVSQHKTVARIDHLFTVVFKPAKNTFLLSIPSRLYTSGADNKFIELPLNGVINNVASINTVALSQPPNAEIVDTRAVYRQVLNQFEAGKPLLELIPLIEKAEHLAPEETFYKMVQALIYLKHANSDDEKLNKTMLEQSFVKLDQINTMNASPYYLSLVALLQGRILTMARYPDLAKEAYAKVSKEIWPSLNRAYDKDMKKPYIKENLKSMAVDLYFGDLSTF